jgi:hypothetical protein
MLLEIQGLTRWKYAFEDESFPLTNTLRQRAFGCVCGVLLQQKYSVFYNVM